MRRILLLAVAFVCVGRLEAQVGHDPAHSPYSDIKFGKSITLLYGHFGGDGGKADVGPRNGRTFGARFDLRLSAPIQFGLTVEKAELERFVVDADDSVAIRKKGPFDQNLTMIELSMQLNLTGKKTWHRLAPFISGSVGWTHSSGLPSGVVDTSGYRFGNKFYLAPSAGFRAFVTQNIFLRAEARQLFWKLNYPRAYLSEPADQPSADPVNHPNAVIKDGKRSEWEGGPELRVGLGVAF